MDLGSAILVVEDDLDVREALVDLLQILGHDVVAVQGGSEALAYLASHPAPRLILLDLEMPEVDGRRFREVQLRDARLASIPVVAVTAGAGLVPAGVPVLAKPFDLERLTGVVCPAA